MATIDLELNADFRKATSDISKFSKDSSKALDGLKAGFQALAVAAGAVASAFAVKKITDAAANQEQAVRSLNAALALTGDYSREASASFQEWAAELQNNSTVGDEVSLSLVGLVKSMGATDEQTKKIIEAAVNLSSVTGETLEGSVRNLAKTLGGLKGELGETQPELRGLTAEQLKAGVGIDILSTKYAGLAKELKKTFAGSVKDVDNSFGDLLEEVGALITQNPLVVKAINLVSVAFKKLGQFIKDNRQDFIDFVNKAIVGAVRGFGYLLDVAKPIIAAFKVISSVIVDSLIVNLGFLAEKAVDAADFIIKAFKTAINFGFAPLNKAVETVASGLNTFGIISDEQFSNFKKTLSDLNADSSISGLEAIKTDLKNFNNVAQEAFDDTTSLEGLTARFGETQSAIEKSAQQTLEFADSLDEMRKSSKNADKSLQQLSDTNKELKAQQAKPFGERTFEFGRISVTGAQLLQGGGALASGIGAGAAGAGQLLTQGAATGIEAILPGAGAIAGPIAQLLAAGPESAKLQVEAFIDQIPVIIDNLVEAAPAIIDALAENADTIIIALIEAIPKVAVAMAIEIPRAVGSALVTVLDNLFDAFVEGVKFNLSKVFGNFGAQAKEFFVNLFSGVTAAFQSIFTELPKQAVMSLSEGITQGLPDIINGLINGLADFFLSAGEFIGNGIFDALSNLGDFIIEPIKNFFDKLKIPGLGDIGGGGGGGFFGKVKKALPFAEGGEVPSGFPNDSFPARLSSGENVIDRSTNEKLNAFLDGASAPTKIVLQVGERELANVLLNLNRQGFRTA